jgi:hypothetical protein
MEEIRSADWTEAEPELGALITGAHIFCGVTEDLVWDRETRQCCEDAAGPLLAGKAMTDANNSRLALDLDPQLPAVTRSRPR